MRHSKELRSMPKMPNKAKSKAESKVKRCIITKGKLLLIGFNLCLILITLPSSSEAYTSIFGDVEEMLNHFMDSRGIADQSLSSPIEEKVEDGHTLYIVNLAEIDPDSFEVIVEKESLSIKAKRVVESTEKKSEGGGDLKFYSRSVSSVFRQFRLPPGVGEKDVVQKEEGNKLIIKVPLAKSSSGSEDKDERMRGRVI